MSVLFVSKRCPVVWCEHYLLDAAPKACDRCEMYVAHRGVESGAWKAGAPLLRRFYLVKASSAATLTATKAHRMPEHVTAALDSGLVTEAQWEIE